jgi:hypothetical protein
MTKDYDDCRRKLWCDVYVSYVGSSNSQNSDGAKTWADTALKRFDERFPPPEIPVLVPQKDTRL